MDFYAKEEFLRDIVDKPAAEHRTATPRLHCTGGDDASYGFAKSNSLVAKNRLLDVRDFRQTT